MICKSNENLFKDYKSLASIRERVKFLHQYFWDNMIISKDYNINCTNILNRHSLILDIVKYSLENRDFIMVHEIDLVCTCISLDKSQEAKKITKEYNQIMDKLPPDLKKVFIE